MSADVTDVLCVCGRAYVQRRLIVQLLDPVGRRPLSCFSHLERFSGRRGLVAWKPAAGRVEKCRWVKEGGGVREAGGDAWASLNLGNALLDEGIPPAGGRGPYSPEVSHGRSESDPP